MAVDLNDLLPSLRREITPLGSADPYANVTDDTLLGYLTDAFWEGRLYGMFGGFTVDEDGILTPLSGVDDMTRDEQQAIVLWAGYRTVLSDLRQVQSVFRAKAGPVEYETQHSAQLLQAILKAIKDKIDYIAQIGSTRTVVFDQVYERIASYQGGPDPYSYWVR